jgi:hypothetical protein
MRVATTSRMAAPLSSTRIDREVDDSDIALAETIARVTDRAMLDPIIGLVLPGAGDLLTAAVGLYVVAVAARRRLPAVVLARMLMNLGIDAAVGSIPLAGDLFDFAFQANRKNVELLRARHGARRSRPTDWLIVAGAGLLFLAALALPIILLVLFIRAIA